MLENEQVGANRRDFLKKVPFLVWVWRLPEIWFCRPRCGPQGCLRTARATIWVS